MSVVLTRRSSRAALAAALALVATGCRSGAPQEGPSAPAATAPGTEAAAAGSAGDALVQVDGEPGRPEVVSVPGTAVSFALVPLPGGQLDGRPVGPFAIATLEVTWDDYMTMVTETEGPPASKDGTPIDGLARPTKPYIATDRGFGMGRRPVISISELGAESFCTWLSLRTGRRFRLPTETEWEWAARAGALGTGADAGDLGASAWYADNSDLTTHEVGRKAPNAFGLHDVLGNVAEWCRADVPVEGRWGRHVLRGGSFLDPAELVSVDAREVRDASWNQSDPQIPKSVWWLADAAWPGMRVVMELE